MSPLLRPELSYLGSRALNSGYPKYIYIYYMGWVGVGWQRRCKMCRSLRELDNQGTLFLFFRRSPWLPVELDHLCGVQNLTSAQGNYRIT